MAWPGGAWMGCTASLRRRKGAVFTHAIRPGPSRATRGDPCLCRLRGVVVVGEVVVRRPSSSSSSSSRRGSVHPSTGTGPRSNLTCGSRSKPDDDHHHLASLDAGRPQSVTPIPRMIKPKPKPTSEEAKASPLVGAALSPVPLAHPSSISGPAQPPPKHLWGGGRLAASS